jgi:excinuclease ABC subunit A
MSDKATVEPDVGPYFIEVRGARQHNLKNVDVQIPHGQLTVVTGPSGSGKSSLAISTIFAEGQRQYIETLSTYARQFVDELPRPDFDSVEGLQPTLCIDQNPSSNSPRSTVGTVTEIQDFLRVLMARAADLNCHQCGSPIQQKSADRIVEWVADLPEGTRAMIMAPLVRGRKGRHEEALERIRKAGLLRVRVDGQMMEVDTPIRLNVRQNHTIEAVADRIVVREGSRQRIAESIGLALGLADGSCLVRYRVGQSGDGHDQWRETAFSTRFACPRCDVTYAELEPRNFSFNSPYGACPGCQGLGWTEQFDEDMVLDLSRSLNEGGVVPWQSLTAATRQNRIKQLKGFLQRSKLDADTVLSEFRPRQLRRLVEGDSSDWFGLMTALEKELATCTSEARLDELESFRGLVVCAECDGSRLGPQARSASLQGQTIIDINRAPLDDALRFFEQLEFADERRDIGVPLAAEIATRLRFLCHVGLEYLTLDRPADSLSGGEYQRVRLASSIGSGLANVCYVLDEPTIGLHPADNQRLIQSIQDLKRAGNTVMVVEHDADMMRQADWIVDLGPAAGADGGQVLFAGGYEGLLDHPHSSTARFLSARRSIQRPAPPRPLDPQHVIRIEGASANNLDELDVEIPLGLFVCVTGVSGSGKSTLVDDMLTAAIRRSLGMAAHRPGAHRALQIVGPLDNLVRVDQRPIGRSARSNPATYTGIMDHIRRLFAATRTAKARGYTVSRFSFNSKSGMCPACQGYGQRKIEMNFLPDMFASCEQCRGRRYNHQTLEVRYRDHSIADVLQMSVSDACLFFENVERIRLPLQALRDIGLGYLSLGQPSPTLSGGEAQRVKLATEIARNLPGHCLYLLDEPTTGLHFQDVERLLLAIHRLVENGNSVLLVEHHMDLVRAADWIIDLGPGGGQHGGKIVASGPPEVVRQTAASRTGRFL